MVFGTFEISQDIGFSMPQAMTTITRPPSTPDFESFEEFWLYYLRAHSKAQTRAMHVFGTTVGLLGVATWLSTGRAKYLAAGLAGSYASAWVGHFVFEGNTPATFEKPLWSFQADLRMYRLWLEGRLDAEIHRAFDKMV